MTKPDSTTFEFKESPTGLYYMDAETQVQQQAQVHVNTVADVNKSSYSNTDYLCALAARKQQESNCPRIHKNSFQKPTTQLPNQQG